ncbi:MAG TPA: hypothetical protein PLR02_15610, partial [Rhodocyclaceae bacterium]|nr:hypothetical protein [Rhodocyclaceae bacterium]
HSPLRPAGFALAAAGVDAGAGAGCAVSMACGAVLGTSPRGFAIFAPAASAPAIDRSVITPAVIVVSPILKP